MKLKRLIERFFEVLTHIQKPKQHRVFFVSFGGQYNDNPKYISLFLNNTHPEYKQFWYISNKSTMRDLPSYATILKKKDFKFYRIKNSCKFIVDNSAGFYLFYDEKHYRAKAKLINRKQFDISTWHGFPIKNIGACMFENRHWKPNYLFTSSNVMLSGSKTNTNIFKKSYLNKLNIIETGSPRNDILFDDNVSIENLKKKLCLPLDKKIILYAPTYRDTPEDSGIIQISNINFDLLFNALNDKFGGNWIFVFRTHNMVLLALKEKQSSLFGKYIISGNDFDDMAEYLKVCDVLLTDYSGCIYDVMLTKKPCFLYAHDRSRYCSIERGVQININDLPYAFSDSFDKLLENIINYDEKNTRSRVSSFLSSVGCVEDGKASKRAVDIILSFEKNNGTNF